jgi:hypothetical protein
MSNPKITSPLILATNGHVELTIQEDERLNEKLLLVKVDGVRHLQVCGFSQLTINDERTKRLTVAQLADLLVLPGGQVVVCDQYTPPPVGGWQLLVYTVRGTYVQNMTASQQRLVILYAQMSELTAPECAHTCRVPWSCCHSIYCEAAIMWAKAKWDVELVKTNHPTLPMMGPSGCTVAPHLRPMCTVHTCEVNSLGVKRGDLAWTKRYFVLREEIDELEFENLKE